MWGFILFFFRFFYSYLFMVLGRDFIVLVWDYVKMSWYLGILYRRRMVFDWNEIVILGVDMLVKNGVLILFIFRFGKWIVWIGFSFGYVWFGSISDLCYIRVKYIRVTLIYICYFRLLKFELLYINVGSELGCFVFGVGLS